MAARPTTSHGTRPQWWCPSGDGGAGGGAGLEEQPQRKVLPFRSEGLQGE